MAALRRLRATAAEDLSTAIRQAATASLYAAGADPVTLRALTRQPAGEAASGAGSGYVVEPQTYDFNRDGIDELLGLRQLGSQLELAVLDGTSGKPLWAQTGAGDVGYAFLARVGPEGMPGLIVQRFDLNGGRVSLAAAYHVTLTLTALSGRGDVVWQTSFTGAVGDAFFSEARTQMPFVGGYLNAIPGRATDVLVEQVAASSGLSAAEAYLVDGREGTTILNSSQAAAERDVYVLSTPDLSGDDLDDYAWVAAGQMPMPVVGNRIVAINAGEGSVLWEREINSNKYMFFAEPVGDLSADGVSEIVLSSGCGNCGFLVEDSYWCPQPCSELLDLRPALWIIDGKTGEIRFRRAGRVQAASDIDGDGVRDLIVQVSERAYVTYRAFNGKGRTLFRRSHLLGEWQGIRLWPKVGDVDGDRIEDAIHGFVRLKGGDIVRQRDAVVSGANGRSAWSGVAGSPVLAALDGSGDDLLRTDSSRGKVGLVAQDGRTGRVLWKKDLTLSSASVDAIAATDVNGDGLNDIILTVHPRPSGTFLNLALSGRDGQMLWRR